MQGIIENGPRPKCEELHKAAQELSSRGYRRREGKFVGEGRNATNAELNFRDLPTSTRRLMSLGHRSTGSAGPPNFRARGASKGRHGTNHPGETGWD